MFKKILLFSIVLFFLITSIFANSQKYYTTSSYEWRMVNMLCHYSGVTGPSSFSPITASQLLLAIERAEERLGSNNSLVLEAKRMLSPSSVIYSDENGSVSLSGIINAEMYTQTASPWGEGGEYKNVYDADEDWFIKGQNDRKALAELLLENTIKDNLYTRLSLEIKNKISMRNDGSDYSPIFNRAFSLSFKDFYFHQNIPTDAGISLGTDSISFILGRSRMSQGEGYTGNTAIGDNYEYQEFLKFGFYTKRTSVFLSLTNFDSSHKEGLKPYEVLSSRFSDYKELRHSINYEIMPSMNTRVSLSLVTLLDTNNSFDFRFLNPFMIFHDYYNYQEESIFEANNLFSLDFSYSFLNKWNLYLQLTMDQAQFRGEIDYFMQENGFVEPNAFGALFNISYTDVFDNGLFNLYCEAVYNMPGMYLNTKFYDSEGRITQKKTGNSANVNGCFSQDFLQGYTVTESQYSDISYSTYKYGPDCFVFSLGGSYDTSKYAIASSFLYMAHGEKGRGEDYNNYTFEGLDDEESITRLALWGTVEQTFVVKAECEIFFPRGFSLSFGSAYSYRYNYRNIEGKTFGNLQSYISFSMSSK